MAAHPRDASAGYDPLQAVGKRLGTPIGREFFDRHVDILTKAFGRDLVADIEAVSAHQDESAAERLCSRLCPGTTFTVTEGEHSIAIKHDSGFSSGVHVVDSDPFFSMSRAVALASASMQLNGDIRSGKVLPAFAAPDQLRLAA